MLKPQACEVDEEINFCCYQEKEKKTKISKASSHGPLFRPCQAASALKYPEREEARYQ